MGFVEVRLADTQLEQPKQPSIGQYVFDLVPGATVRPNKFTGVEELNVSASIVSTKDGDTTYAGRRVFWTYPDPTSISANGKPKSWSLQALKKLEIALGEDSTDGESPVEYLNRAATNGHTRFSAALVPETRKNAETGEYEPYVRPGASEPKAVFSIFSVGAAA